MTWLFLIICIGSIPLAAEMARERGRSTKAWLWTAAFVGPFAPLALLLLGQKRQAVPGH